MDTSSFLSNPLELVARLDVLMRPRIKKQVLERLRVGILEMDLLGHVVRCGAHTLELLPGGYRVLE